MEIDFLTLLLFPGIFNGLLGVLVLAFMYEPAQRRSIFWLLFLLVGILVILTEQFFRQTGLIREIPFLLFFSTPVFFCFLPIIFCFQQSLNDKKWKWWIHYIIPALILVLMIPTYGMPAEEKLAMFYAEDSRDPLWLVLLYLTYWLVYVFMIFKSQQKYTAALKEERSDDSVEKAIFSNQLIAIIGWAALIFPISICLQFIPISQGWYGLIQKCLFLMFSLSPHFLLFILIKNREFIGLPSSPPNQEKDSSAMDLASKKQILQEKMISAQWYLDPELNLTTLAEEMKWSRTDLSMIINRGFGKNFYDYINTMRVEEVISRLKNKDHNKYALDYIVKKSGFKSYTSFYRVFKKMKGYTPTQFLKKGDF